MTLAGDASPAKAAVLGFLSEHRTFSTLAWDFTVQLDSGEKPVLKSHRIHREGTPEADDRWIADFEGDVFLFTQLGMELLCSSSASAHEALSAFRKAVPASWFLVI